MIVTSLEMKQIEKSSGVSEFELMKHAGKALSSAIEAETKPDERILVIAGSGNNGGDGAVICSTINRPCTIIYADGKPKTDSAKKAMSELPDKSLKTLRSLDTQLNKADVIIDAVYGFGFHGELKTNIRSLFSKLKASGKRIFSVDINSGAEADSNHFDRGALHSQITFALDCYKPFHMLRKEHHLFEKTVLLPLDLPHEIKQTFYEMNEEIFFRNFPKKSETAYKTSNGKTVIVGGCFGMAGAVGLNILGARTMGASYIDVALPEEIYPIVASWHRTAVFHPFGEHSSEQVIEPLIRQAGSVVFGSGAVYMPRKYQCMDMILQSSTVPVVLDAEALRMLHHNTYILRFIKCPVIVTPHISEFSTLTNKPVEVLSDNRIFYAKQFAKEYNVIVVLKGPHTIVASPLGEVYINQSGNQALAQAGSGDMLAGIIGALLSLSKDIFRSVCMGVWMHGHIADLGLEKYSIQNFPLEKFPVIMDELFRKYSL